MNDVANIETARARKARDALDGKARWTPREALVAALADLDSGGLKPEALVIVYSEERVVDGEPTSRVGRYVSANGTRGPLDSFWLIGMMSRAIADWTRGS